MPPKKRAGRPKKRVPGFAKWKRDQKEAKEAAAKEAEAAQQVQHTTGTLDTPPSAPTQANASTSLCLFGPIEQQGAIPSPQIGPSSGGTATESLGGAAQSGAVDLDPAEAL